MGTTKDHYIRALEYAESKTEFTLGELAKELGLNDVQKRQLALQIHEKQIFQHVSPNYLKDYATTEIPLNLSVEDKFRLLNYAALEESRRFSKRAAQFAIAALSICIFSALASIYYSIQQIHTGINLPAGLVKRIEDIDEHIAQMNDSLSSLKETAYFSSKGKTKGERRR